MERREKCHWMLFSTLFYCFLSNRNLFFICNIYDFLAYILIVLTKERGKLMKLNELKLGDCAYVVNISNESCISRRLLDIGLIPGTKVECVLVSPVQNPKAYMIRGAVIAIRNEDAFDIDVEYKGEG